MGEGIFWAKVCLPSLVWTCGRNSCKGNRFPSVKKQCFWSSWFPLPCVLLLSPAFIILWHQWPRHKGGQPNGLLGSQPCQELVVQSLRTSAEYPVRRLAFTSIPQKDLPETFLHHKGYINIHCRAVWSMLTNKWIFVFITQKPFTPDLPIIHPSLDV